MTMNTTTDTETKAPTTPTRGESAVRHLWKRATEEGREADAKLIATVSNLLQPSIKLSAGLPVPKPADDPKKKKVDSASVDGSEVDLSGMEDRDAADYAAYAREMDGSAARERHIARLEAEDAELREEADETLQQYDTTTGELARLRLEIHGLHHEAAEIPARLQTARLDAMVPSSPGEDAEDLQRRYIAVRERLPVAEARIGRLEEELSSLVSGSRPAQVSAEGGQRRLVKHTAREPGLAVLTEVVQDLERLRESLPDTVKDATAPLLKERDTLRDGQNQLWGLAKRR